MIIHYEIEDELDEDKLDEKCGCGSEEFTVKYAEGPHYFSQVCFDCGKHIKFIGKEKNHGSRTESTEHDIDRVLAVTRQDESRCFFCSRKKEQLGERETLELDHITPVSEGGEDRPENLQVLCTACHKLRHHRETYLFKHFYGADN